MEAALGNLIGGAVTQTNKVFLPLKESSSIDVTPAEYDQLRNLDRDCRSETISISGILAGYDTTKWADGVRAILGDRFALVGEATSIRVVNEGERED